MQKVTAIITTRNRLSLLARAVASVREQSYPNVELIVVDDGSTDGTIEWCKQNQVNVLDGEGKGGNHARNLGINAATGTYVAFLDDDDYWFKDKVAKQVALAESSGCGVVYCGIRKERKLANDQYEYIETFPKTENTGDVSKRILQEIITITSALMVKRNLLNEVGAFDEAIRYWQEYELTIRLAQKTKFAAVNELLVGYLIDSTDKNRLTNKYDSWKQSVSFIHRKHKALYSKLSIIERIHANRVVLWDAISRSESAELRYKNRWNKLLLRLSFKYESVINRLIIK